MSEFFIIHYIVLGIVLLAVIVWAIKVSIDCYKSTKSFNKVMDLKRDELTKGISEIFKDFGDQIIEINNESITKISEAWQEEIKKVGQL